MLLNTKTDWAHTLNPSGALVWEFCDGVHNVQDIAAELVAGTQSPDAAQLTTAVGDLVRQLVDENLLSLHESTTRL